MQASPDLLTVCLVPGCNAELSLCFVSSSLDDTLWSTTYLPHVYFTTWFCSFPGGRISLKATFWKPGAQEQRHNAEILQAFGPEKILQRLHRELEDPTVLDVALHSALAQLLDFSLDIQSHLLPSQTYKPVLKALTRQTRFGKSGTFLNAECWTSAGGLITLMAVGQEFHACFGPMITHCEFVDALANALTIDMSDDAQKADAWCDLVPHIAAFGLKCRMTRDAVDEPVYNALYSALRRVWWPTLCRLRALQQPGAAPSSRSIRAFAVWLDLGEKSGLSEEAERTRHESGAPGSLILWCSWKECMYRTKEPPSPLMKCSGCGQAFYCDNNCQTRLESRWA
ncbi:hypothetical protein OF83DRAFT_19071 [Amylostereum chailletii]|nr:hypothetical protein OF83DRAFT_19071 [Amylostereum chailletii]